MGKRFADTKVTRESWYRRLSPAFKCAWRFLADECDAAGAWPVDMDSMEFHVGAPIDLKEFLAAVNSDKPNRLITLGGDKLFIPGFIEFQYGTLSEDCKPHKPVIERLKKLNLSKGYRKGFETLQDKEKDKDKEKDMEMDKEKEEGAISKSELPAVLAALYQEYPRKEGKSKGLAKLKLVIKSQADADKFREAVARYRDKVTTDRTEPKFIKMFSTFVNDWTDWLDADAGTSIGAKGSILDEWQSEQGA